MTGFTHTFAHGTVTITGPSVEDVYKGYVPDPEWIDLSLPGYKPDFAYYNPKTFYHIAVMPSGKIEVYDDREDYYANYYPEGLVIYVNNDKNRTFYKYDSVVEDPAGSNRPYANIIAELEAKLQAVEM